MREFKVTPWQVEIFPWSDKEARLIVNLKDNLITAPGLQGINAQEMRAYNVALNRAFVLLDWAFHMEL